MNHSLNPHGEPWTKHNVVAGPLGFYASPGRYLLGATAHATPAATGADYLARKMPDRHDPVFFSWLVQAQWDLDIRAVAV